MADDTKDEFTGVAGAGDDDGYQFDDAEGTSEKKEVPAEEVAKEVAEEAPAEEKAEDSSGGQQSDDAKQDEGQQGGGQGGGKFADELFSKTIQAKFS